MITPELFFYRSEEQSTAATAATASDRGAKVIGFINVDRETRLPRTYLAPGYRKRAGCEDGTAKLRNWCRRPAILFLLSASASTRGHQRTSATKLLQQPRSALSSSASRHHSGEVARVLVIVR